MKRALLTLLVPFLFCGTSLKAQFSYGDQWYSNPLGFEPVKLHTAMGFLLPAAAVGTCLLLTKNDTALSRRLSVFHESGYSWGYKYPFAGLSQHNTGVNLMLRRWLSVGADIDLYFARDQFNNVAGVGIRPFARFYPVNRSGWKLYFESGGGLIYFFEEFPQPTDQDGRLGTFLNGTTRYGIGTELRLAGSTFLLAGVRHVHVSNGNRKGVERNPSHDSNGFFVGCSLRL